VRWVSTSGEFAFLSIGGIAKGIIAIGGVAHGVVAIGGIASAGVISIGMNAIGSVVAVGMNSVAPISLSLINGLGIYSAAGVNGWGAWSHGGTNASGLAGHGGVNTSYSVVPAVLVIGLLIVLSSVVRGKRGWRAKSDLVSLRRFVRSPELREEKVNARIVAVRDDGVELRDGAFQLSLRADPRLVARARGIATPYVTAHLARVEERVPVAAEVSYRERPPETERVVLSCVEIEAAPEPDGFLPKDEGEVQWVIAWTARAAAVVSIAILVPWVFG
jgi:hypothetical protein